MFYEKWFDRGDLIFYQPEYNFAVYDDYGEPYSTREFGEKEIGLFLGYSGADQFDSCQIYIFSYAKTIIVPQYQLKLLSKNQ